MLRFAIWFFAAVVPAAALAAPKYHAVELGLPDHKVGEAVSLANDGSIAMTGTSAGGYIRLANGQFVSVPSIVGGLKGREVLLTSADTFSFNDWGSVSVFGGERTQIFGDIPGDYYGTKVSKTTLDGDYCFTVYNTTSLFDHKAKGYYLRNGQWQLINKYQGQYATRAIAVNIHGDVVGSAGYSSEFMSRSFIIPRRSTSPQDIPLREVYDINDRGTVLGDGGGMASYDSHGIFRSIKVPGAQYSIGYDHRVKLNNRDQVAWHEFHNGVRDPFLWEAGQSWWLRDLLDNRSILPETASFQDLGFNDHGQIAGSFFENGKTRLFRFDPVPEPATYLALGLGLAVIMRLRR